ALAALVQIEQDLGIRLAPRFDEIDEPVPRDDVLDTKSLFRPMIRGEVDGIPAAESVKATLLPFRRRHYEKPGFLRRSIDRENRVVKIFEAAQVIEVRILLETGFTPTFGRRKGMQENDSVGHRIHDRVAPRLKLARVDSHVRK